MDDVEYKKDFEDTLEDEDTEPLQFWEERQRDLVTSVVDYNLATLVDLITNRDIDLSPRYQRRFRWDDERQSKLIESFLMNVPVPPIFLNEDAYGAYSVIDGKQRLTAIHNFLRGRLTLRGLKVFADINGMHYDDLPSRLQTILKTRVTIRAVIVLRQSDPEIKFEVFRRINTGGVKLNAQEIRNSVYPGAFNDLILDLSEEKKFHRLLGIKQPQKSALYQEMRDVEFVLRYFTFRDTWMNFTKGMRANMDTFMREHQKLDASAVNEMHSDFLNTLDIVEVCFGEHAFKRWLPEQQQWRRQVLASLFDAQMFACRGLSMEQVSPRSQDIIQGYQDLFSDPEFRQAIDAATNTPSYFRKRISLMREMILEKISQ